MSHLAMFLSGFIIGGILTFFGMCLLRAADDGDGESYGGGK